MSSILKFIKSTFVDKFFSFEDDLIKICPFKNLKNIKEI